VPAAVVDGPASEQADQPVEVVRADDSAVVRTLLRIVAVEVEHRFFQVFQELPGNVLEHEDVVRGGAGLAGVVPAALDDAAGRDAEIGRGVDDGRAFAAELEDDRC
jgi:hypothetical protein